MEIPITPQRRAWGDYDCHMGPHRNKTLEDFLKTIKEVKIIKKMDTPRFQGCCWFVFKNEDWFKKMTETQRESLLLTNAFEVLNSKGYHEVTKPKNRDIAVYFFNSAGERESVVHYGRYINGKILSKFGKGHVFEHPIEMVPDYFGNGVKFFSRQYNKTL